MAVNGKRIKQHRKEAGLTQEALGKKLGVIKQTISSWENGISEPNSEMLTKIASIFNVPTDYLLGLSDNLIESSDFNWKYPPASNRLGNIMNTYRHRNSLTETEFSQKLNISQDLYRNIEIGKYEPTLELLKKIANETHYDIDYLTGATDHISILTNETMAFPGGKIPIYIAEGNSHFKTRLEELCLENSINQANVETRLGLSKQDFIDIQWNRMPTLSELLKISYAFGVSLDYLIGKTDTRLSSLSSDELELVLNYRDCLPRYKENISKRTEKLCIESLREKELESVAADDLGDTGTYGPK